MPTTDDRTDEELLTEHDRMVSSVAEAVAGLVPRYAVCGMTPVAVFEGAFRGAMAAMIHYQGSTTGEVADMLDEFAWALRHPNSPDLQVVK